MSAAANNFVLGTDLDFTTVNQIKATSASSSSFSNDGRGASSYGTIPNSVGSRPDTSQNSNQHLMIVLFCIIELF